MGKSINVIPIHHCIEGIIEIPKELFRLCYNFSSWMFSNYSPPLFSSFWSNLAFLATLVFPLPRTVLSMQ